MRSQRLRKVAGGEADATAGSGHQDPLSGVETTQFDKPRIGSVVGCSHRGALCVVEAVGEGGEAPYRDRSDFGEGPGLVATDDPVARFEAAFGIGLDDFAGKFEAQSEGRLGFELVFALRHQQVRKIERRGMDPDQSLSGLSCGRRDVLQADAREVIAQR